ncbi:MAG TPA: nitrite/sulfite reductase, partial [Methylothermaceae bacterium]|nr:nitrite/sulfite reductase [Methylothermaceae bacterium]
AHIARTYDKGYVHFTTRQNIQLNWPRVEDVPAILEDLASVQMHAIQTSGNCIRNVTSDPLAGVCADEVEDPRPYCEIIRQWSTLHPEFAFLPRKFKIAVTGAPRDRAAVRVHDIGLRLVRNQNGETGFEVIVGGGLGRTPIIGQVIRPFLPKRDLLTYLEAILRVYNLYGRRDNMFKARIKILVKAMGVEAFARAVEEEWRSIRDDFPLEVETVRWYQSRFVQPDYEASAEVQTWDELRRERPDFDAWYRHNTADHKVPGYRVVFLSLKPPGVAPGDLTSEQLDRVAELSERYSFGITRTNHTQNLVFADVRQRDLFELWQALREINLATPNIGKLTDMICCPGLDYCALANASSISVALDIYRRFEDLDYLYDLGDIRVNLSGCMNGCGHHSVAHIGILGVDKKGEEWYQLTLGGSSSDDASLGQRLGPAVAKDRVADTIETIIRTYVDLRLEEEPFLATVRRVGVDPFKERVYANH